MRRRRSIVESVPERLDIKHSTLVAIDAGGTGDSDHRLVDLGVQAPSELSVDGADRLVVGHPFNPVYLLPVVEVVASPATTDEVIERAKATWYRGDRDAPAPCASGDPRSHR